MSMLSSVNQLQMRSAMNHAEFISQEYRDVDNLPEESDEMVKITASPIITQKEANSLNDNNFQNTLELNSHTN